MELLPPVGWADVATKPDLSHLADRTDLRFAAVDARFDQVDARFDQVDARFDQVDARFDAIERRLERHEATFATQESLDALRREMDGRFGELDRSIEWRIEAFEARMHTGFADLRSELNRALRLNLVVTVGVLGTLVAVVGALTGA